MSFPWKSYIDLAGELLNTANISAIQEAYLRSAISRSYYGVFGIARNYLIRNGVRIPFVDTHKFVSTQYQKSSVRTRKEIGEKLKRLWRERKTADYDESTGIGLARARTSQLLALQILEKFKAIGAP
ncbi:hypothetical protein L0156_05760 [bacterium]|nr:hypothetical protein [bacterium]